MKRNLQKTIFSIACLLCSIGVYAHDFVVDGIYYNITSETNKTVDVTYRGSSYDSYNNEYKGSVVIPDSVTYQGEIYNVTSIGSSAFYYCTGLTEVTIGNSVTSIGDRAFYYCTGLKSLTIEDGDATLELGYNYYSSSYNGKGLFYDCPIETLYIGRNLSYSTDYDLGYSPFARINELKTVTIGNNVTSIGDCAFYECTGLTEVTIGNSVTSIGDRAFYYCTGLTEVTISNSVTSIGNDAFAGCTGLKSLTIEDGDATLELGYNYYSSSSYGEGLFYDCPIETLYIGRNLSYSTDYDLGYSPFAWINELKTVTIGNSVTSIGDRAFYYCTGLKEVTIPNSVTSIGAYAFSGCTGLTEITIPNSVTSIGNDAFAGCTGLTEITIPNSVTSIGERAFQNCTGLTEITIPNSVTSIGERAFQNCTGLTSITIPNSVTSIGDRAFYYCTGLKEVTIPNSVTSIGLAAFSGCTGLISVTIGNSVTEISNTTFQGCSISKTIWLTNTPPNGYKNVSSKVHYVANEQYTGLSNVKIYPYISSLFETGGVKYVPVSPSERTCDAIDCCYNSTATIIQIDSMVLYKGVAMTVKEVMPYTLYNHDYIKALSINNSGNIGNYACYDCNSISCAILGDSIKSIGSNTFSNCTSLSEIVIPNGVISIGESAFNGCTSMTKAIIGNGVTSIGSSAFAGCASLDSIYIGRKVATVGKNAFYDCKKLADITIPAGVTTIGDYVFSGCTSLSDVVIEDRTTALSLGSNGSSGLFADCPLDSVYIGGKITYKTSSSYGYSPFYRNTSLRTVVITDTETEIYDNEFYGCSNLTKVTIGDGVKKIGNWAFSGCSSLDHFAFGTNVESIGQEAFSDCTNVTNIRSYSAVPPVCDTQALDDINKWNCTLSVLENCQSAYQTAEQWKEFFFVNAMVKDGKVVAPVIVVDSVVVTISCETAKTTIYYTTDGSEPTVESALYTGPFVVDKNCTIKAIAVRTNYYNSDISTAQVDYFVYAESIAIDYETVSIRLNESVTLTATVLPETTTNKEVVWTSSDSEVASVENGIVTAHKVGTAIITATTTDGSNLTATCEVTVEATLATSITLDQTNITAIEGETVVLTATIYPEDATEKGVVWSVSDETIVTIEPIDNVSAKVTVLREGVATITATTIDGSNLSATCTIDVSLDIEALLRDSEDVEYYDLNGFRIENPTRGIFIMKQGSTVKKVVLKN